MTLINDLNTVDFGRPSAAEHLSTHFLPTY